MSQKMLKNANRIQLAFFFFLIWTHKLALVNLLVNIGYKNMRSKWTVFKQMMHSFQDNPSISLPTYPYIEIGAREWEAEDFSWSEGLHLFLSVQNQQTLCL